MAERAAVKCSPFDVAAVVALSHTSRIVARVSGHYHSAKETLPEWQRGKEISLFHFISSMLKGVGQLLPGDISPCALCSPDSMQQRTLVAKRCNIHFLEVNRMHSEAAAEFLC